MDAITMLKDDHKTVEKLFKDFEQAGERAYVTKRGLVDRIIEELSVHAAVEEQFFYPVTRATVPEVEDDALESLEEHHVVKIVLAELETMNPEDERFDAKVNVLIENVRHHVEEEEDEYFPKVRAELGRNALNDIGDAMAEAKKTAPTKPHPESPQEPPANFVVGAVAGVADRVTDTVHGVAQGGVTAVGDLIARIRGQQRRSPAPTGSRLTRRQADKVRSAANEAADALIAATRKAKQEGQDATERAGDAASAATTGAKRTATTAARGAAGAVDETTSAAKATATTAGRSTGDAAKDTKAAAKRTGSTATRSAGEAAKETKRAAKGTATATKRRASGN
jgi:hemerythrin superfamily protein